MNSLDDEILALMASVGAEPTADLIAARLAVTTQNARDAMRRLNESGRAALIQSPGSRQLYLTWPDARPAGARNICIVCHKAFERPAKSKRKCCGRSCAMSLSWRKPGVREARCEGNTAEKMSPKGQARIAAHNKRRWSKPEEHAKLSEKNRREWEDPVIRGKRARGVRQSHQTPEQRKIYSDIRRAQWATPEFRDKTVAGIRASKKRVQNTPELRARILATRLANNAARRAARRTPERLSVIEKSLSEGRSVAECATAIGEKYAFTYKWVCELGLDRSGKMSDESRAKMRTAKLTAPTIP